MTYDEKKRKYNDDYDKNNMKIFSVKMNLKLFQLLENSVRENGKNRNALVCEAIREKLEREGKMME